MRILRLDCQPLGSLRFYAHQWNKKKPLSDSIRSSWFTHERTTRDRRSRRCTNCRRDRGRAGVSNRRRDRRRTGPQWPRRFGSPSSGRSMCGVRTCGSSSWGTGSRRPTLKWQDNCHRRSKSGQNLTETAIYPKRTERRSLRWWRTSWRAMNERRLPNGGRWRASPLFLLATVIVELVPTRPNLQV